MTASLLRVRVDTPIYVPIGVGPISTYGRGVYRLLVVVGVVDFLLTGETPIIVGLLNEFTVALVTDNLAALVVWQHVGQNVANDREGFVTNVATTVHDCLLKSGRDTSAPTRCFVPTGEQGTKPPVMAILLVGDNYS